MTATAPITLLDIPRGPLSIVASYLSVGDLAALAAVCTQLRRRSEDDDLYTLGCLQTHTNDVGYECWNATGEPVEIGCISFNVMDTPYANGSCLFRRLRPVCRSHLGTLEPWRHMEFGRQKYAWLGDEIPNAHTVDEVIKATIAQHPLLDLCPMRVTNVCRVRDCRTAVFINWLIVPAARDCAVTY